MSLHQLPLSLLLVFVLQLPSQALATTNFVAVPDSCARILKDFASRKNIEVETTVDWTKIIHNMKELGYPERISIDKLSEIQFKMASAEGEVSEALNKTWRIGDPLNLEKSKKIGFYFAEHRDASFLQELPYWAAIPGLRVEYMVNSFLKNTSGDLDNDELQALANFAPLWLTGRVASVNAHLFIEHTGSDPDEQEFNLSWLLKNLPSASARLILDQMKKNLTRIVNPFGPLDRKAAPTFLRSASTLPWKEIPEDVLKKLRHWIDLETYKPLHLNSIKLISRGYQDAGDCEMMANGHISTLGVASSCNAEPRKNVFIKIDGHIIGSLKWEGDPSMIAMRNVMDPDGRLVLAMGGVYHVAKDIYEKLYKSRETKSVIELDSLQVHPGSFVLNEDAWSNNNIAKFIDLVDPPVTRNDLLKLLELALEGELENSEAAAAWHQRVWQGLLRKIETLRIKLETKTTSFHFGRSFSTSHFFS